MSEDALLSTPVRLDTLDAEHAIFVGSSEATRHVHLPFSQEPLEISVSFPKFVLERAVWEGLGCPTSLTVAAYEEVSV